jgi:serine/threonine-protein kinase
MDERSLLGTTIAGRYLIEKKLGQGGMGTVFVAQNVRLGKRYALKVLNPEVAKSYPAAVDRFKREAETASRLGHVGIVQVHDIDRTEDDILYMVMDLLEGEDLETRMVETGLLPWDAVYRIVTQTCDALATAHEAGIVHRDLKPANIFLSQRKGEGERAVLLDFGVAKVIDAQRALVDEDEVDEGGRKGPTPTLTKPGTIVGTPNYMSPEQASALAVDHRSDIYSMGAVLFHMAAGEPPFNADSLLAVLTMIAIDPVPLVTDVNPSATDRPKGLDDVIRKAMSKDPDKRYRDIREFARALPLPRDAVHLGLAVNVERSGVTAEHEPATPTALETPLPRSTGAATAVHVPKPRERAKEKAPAEPAGTLAGAEAVSRPRPRRLSWAIIGVLMLVGIAAGAIAALGPGFGGTRRGDAGPAAPNKNVPNTEADFDRGLADVQRQIEAEEWASAAGMIAGLRKQFPQRETMFRQMYEQVEMEMESAALHRNAKAQANADREAARQICAQIEVRSVYRSRAPCDELLKAAPPPVSPGPDAGPDKQVKAPGVRPRSLSDREIDQVYRSRRGGAQRCFDNAFSGGFRPTGTIRVAVQATIGATGRVTSAQLLDPRYRSQTGLRVCLENLVRSWEFPESTGSTSREFQFSYTAEEIDLENME